MLTIEQLPEDVKERVIELLSRDGIDRYTVQGCTTGLAITNLGYTSIEESIPNMDKIYENRIKNNREYTIQVLTILQPIFGGCFP